MGDQDKKPLDIENLEVADLEVEELEDVAGGTDIASSFSTKSPNTGCGPNDGCNIPC